MQTITATEDHLDGWLRLRRQLWDEPDELHLQEMDEILATEAMNAFLLLDENQDAVGFVEGALYLEGPRKYGYVEGWYVDPAHRGQGWGGRLLAALEQWILHHSISLVLSDTIPAEYPLSTQAHHGNGYKDLMTLRVFVKDMDNGTPNVE